MLESESVINVFEVLSYLGHILAISWGYLGQSRVGPQVEKSSNLHITADSTGSIHKNARGKKFDPKKVRLGWGDSI